MQERKNKTSDSQKKAVKKYLSKFVDVKIRVTAEDREQIQSHAITSSEVPWHPYIPPGSGSCHLPCHTDILLR